MKHFCYGTLFAMLLIQSCSVAVVATPTLEQPTPVPPTPTLEQPSPAPPTPTAEILEVTSTPNPTIPLLPTLTPATIATSPDAYQLTSGTADRADEIITMMEQAVLEFWETQTGPGNNRPPYDVVWYAAWDALARFPDDPRFEEWRWKMAYYMALSGEGYGATELYSELIADALNQERVTPQDLPRWFQSGELVTTYLTPAFTLEIEPIAVPGNEVGYLLNIGELLDIDTPGSSCVLVVENDDKFTPYIIHDGFPEPGFFITLRNPSSCFAKDVTDDGIDEIIVDLYSGGHVGTTFFHVFDITSLPPKAMPFAPSQDENLIVWCGWIKEYPIVNNKTQFQIGVPLGFCDEYGLSSYQWNGAWFEVSQGWIEFGQSPYRDDDALLSCIGRIILYASDLNPQDAISIFDNAYTAYYPNIQNNFELLEEFRILKGLYSAYHGDTELARSIFNEIANSPTIVDSVWIQPSQDFLEVYQSSSDLYRACSTVNICAPYLGQDSADMECVNIRLCDYQEALEATVATTFSTSPLIQITNDLKLAGVHIPSDGRYNFDGDSRDELWFTVLQPGETEYELWIAAEYSQGVKALLVADHLPSQIIKFESVDTDPPHILTDFGFAQTIELVRHPITGEPFIVVQEVEEVDPSRQDLALFKELRQMLYSGSAAIHIYERLLEIDRKYPNCPFETREKDGSTIGIYDCASFYYTLAFAAELAGKENEAVKRYFDVWSLYPERPFAVLARLKLVQ